MTALFFDRFSKKSERGQVTPVFLVLLVIILMMAGFAVDVADFFLAHQKLKKAADAGALAGATLLCKGGYDDNSIKERAESLAGFNFQETALWKNPSFNATVTPGTIRIDAQADMATLFFRIIMLDKMTVQTVAQATGSETQPAKLVI